MQRRPSVCSQGLDPLFRPDRAPIFKGISIDCVAVIKDRSTRDRLRLNISAGWFSCVSASCIDDDSDEERFSSNLSVCLCP